MKTAMYIFVNKGLGMSTGKAAAQASHAAVEAYRLSKPALVEHWYKGNHYTKLVMEAQDAEQMRVIERYINDRGFKTSLIIDEGLTEIEPHSITALGVEVVDKDDPHTLETFSTFKLYEDIIRATIEIKR
jgi:peptidyl-tRNA hydrolase